MRRNAKKYGLLVLILLVLSTITGLGTLYLDNSYLTINLSFVGDVVENELVLPDSIEVHLNMWDNNFSHLCTNQETFNLTSDGQEFGHFEGMSYNRYIDYSLMWISFSWKASYNESCVNYHVVIWGVDVIEGADLLLWDWMLEWSWISVQSDLRPQDNVLHLVQMAGMISFLLIGGYVIKSVVKNIKTNGWSEIKLRVKEK